MADRLERLEQLNSQLEISEMLSQNQAITAQHLKEIESIWAKQQEIIGSSRSELTMQEFLIDLRVLEKTGSTLGQCIKSIKANTNPFTLSEFASKMNEKFLTNGTYDWMKISDIAIPIINRAPGFPLMLGTFKPTVPFVMPERKKRQVKGKDEEVERQKPENIEMAETNTESIDVKVNFVIKQLIKCYSQNDNNPIPLYNFILHPSNFTTTVENVFYLSFVIRDGHAKIDVIDDDLYISPMERNSQSNSTEKKQMIFTITLQKWEEEVKSRRITRPAINWKN